MSTRTVEMGAWPVVGAAAVSCALFAGNIAAKDQEFTAAYQVSTQGLDPSRPVGGADVIFPA